jgi:hypothetical protein
VNFLTDADPWTFPKREVRVVRTTLLILLCEALWVEFVWIWVVLWVMMQTEDGDINPGAFRKHYSSISGRGRNWIIGAAHPVDEWKNWVLPQSLCEQRRSE